MKNAFAILILLALTLGCSNSQPSAAEAAEIQQLQLANDSLKAVIAENKSNTQKQITTFLTFQGNNAETAMNFYVGLFDNSEIVDVQRYGSEGPAPEGSILLARFKLNGKEFLCTDSYIRHEWDFSPAVSMFVECQNAEEQERLFERLAEKGQVMMPLGNYGFSQRFAWCEDQFGISWQLNLE